MTDFKTLLNFSKYEVNREGEIFNKKCNRQLFGTLHNGYIIVNILNDFTGKSQRRFVHRIVAETFLENSNEFEQIDHIDNNRRNNNVQNLRWCSHSQNLTNRESFSISKDTNKPEKKFKFVSWNKRGNIWKGCVSVNGKSVHIGYSDNDEELYIKCLKFLYTIFKDNEFLSNTVQQDLIKYKIIEP